MLNPVTKGSSETFAYPVEGPKHLPLVRAPGNEIATVTRKHRLGTRDPDKGSLSTAQGPPDHPSSSPDTVSGETPRPTRVSVFLSVSWGQVSAPDGPQTAPDPPT